MAYFLVHSLASSLYRGLSVLKIRAMSGTRGSSGLGSHNRLHIERRTVCMAKEEVWGRFVCVHVCVCERERVCVYVCCVCI